MKNFLFILITITLFTSNGLLAREVKVMFSDSLTSETSTIQPYHDWYLSLDREKTTMSQMYIEGWKLIQAIKLNAVASNQQFWLIFEK